MKINKYEFQKLFYFGLVLIIFDEFKWFFRRGICFYLYLLSFSLNKPFFFCFNSLIKHFSKEEITSFIEEWKRYDTEYNGFLPEKTVFVMITNILNYYISKIDKWMR